MSQPAEGQFRTSDAPPAAKHIVQQLIELATDLRLAGVTEAWSLSPLQLVWTDHRRHHRAKQDLIAAALAARAAQADKDGWTKWTKELTNE